MSEVCALRWPRIAGNVPNELIIELFLGLLMLFLVPRIFLFAALDPTKKNVSNLQLWPMLSISLPDHWVFILYPSADIRVNYGDPVTGQTGRLFLPFDFSVGRSITKDFAVSLEVGVPIIRDYPVYDFKTTTRLNLKF